MTDQPIDLETYRRQARAWLVENVAPGDEVAALNYSELGDDERDVELAAQRRLQRRVFEAGYAGISWPAEYGGGGLPREYEQAFDQEGQHFAMPDFGIAGPMTFHVCGPTMVAHASDAFLETHVPRILAGDELVVQFFSEPEAGSDLAGVRSRAERRDGGWILNGSKVWNSATYYADYGMCLARTDWDAPKHRGLTWFAVPIRATGVTVRRIRQLTGAAEFCEAFFDDVELTDDDVIGEVNDGWTVTQTMLELERGHGMYYGFDERTDASRLAPDLIDLAATVGNLDDPYARDLIARAHTIDVVRQALLVRIRARMQQSPEWAPAFASYGKLAAGTYDPIRAEMALELAERTTTAWPVAGSSAAQVATNLLESRLLAIAGGTNEMQRTSIGERVLGLPREPWSDSQRPFREVVREARDRPDVGRHATEHTSPQSEVQGK